MTLEFFNSIDWNVFRVKYHPFSMDFARLPDGHVFPHGDRHSCGHEDCPADRLPESAREYPVTSHAEAHGY